MKAAEAAGAIEVGTIAAGETHLWWCDLGKPGAAQVRVDLLDPGERGRAERFRFAADRDRFIAGRSALRRLAAAYLGERPEALRFESGPKGKPYLPGSEIRFNLSRTRDAVLLGFARDREIGVDVERVRPGYSGADVAGRFFSPDEVASLEALPEASRPEAFFRCWTAKEAYLKARGDGLGVPLDQFAVSLETEAPQRLRWHADAGEVPRWWMVPLTPAQDYVAAIAVEGDAPAVRFREIG